MKRLFVLSPHRDDAVFSLSVALCYWRTLPIQVTVANVFTRSNYGPHAMTRGEELVAEISEQRRREDRRALAMIDRRIQIESAGLLDAPLRLQKNTASVCNVDEASVRTCDVRLVSTVLERLCRVWPVIAPLGLGNHLDHLTVRAAAIDIVRHRTLAFYEDLPYATWTPENAILERVRDTERRTNVPLHPVVLRNICNIRLKRRFASQYRTQIQSGEATAIAAFASKYKTGERIWIPRYGRLWKSLLQ
ncbi:MAG: PIG-L family deacetylase [Acidobacteriota bacterium]|nr:PIG-L family deacetylase [Acidobacteriota bacterium]